MNNRMPKILTSPTKNAREVVNPAQVSAKQIRKKIDAKRILVERMITLHK